MSVEAAQAQQQSADLCLPETPYICRVHLSEPMAAVSAAQDHVEGDFLVPATHDDIELEVATFVSKVTGTQVDFTRRQHEGIDHNRPVVFFTNLTPSEVNVFKAPGLFAGFLDERVAIPNSEIQVIATPENGSLTISLPRDQNPVGTANTIEVLLDGDNPEISFRGMISKTDVFDPQNPERDIYRLTGLTPAQLEQLITGRSPQAQENSGNLGTLAVVAAGVLATGALLVALRNRGRSGQVALPPRRQISRLPERRAEPAAPSAPGSSSTKVREILDQARQVPSSPPQSPDRPAPTPPLPPTRRVPTPPRPTAPAAQLRSQADGQKAQTPPPAIQLPGERHSLAELLDQATHNAQKHADRAFRLINAALMRRGDEFYAVLRKIKEQAQKALQAQAKAKQIEQAMGLKSANPPGHQEETPPTQQE